MSCFVSVNRIFPSDLLLTLYSVFSHIISLLAFSSKHRCTSCLVFTIIKHISVKKRDLITLSTSESSELCAYVEAMKTLQAIRTVLERHGIIVIIIILCVAALMDPTCEYR